MQLTDILSSDRIAVDIAVSSKKSLLEKAAELLAQSAGSASAREIFESLCQRERLGSTGLGHGVAIPHGRVASQTEVIGAIIRLRRSIEFDAPDHVAVDLFFALAVPEQCTDAHLRLLADIAEQFGDSGRRDELRQAGSAQEVLKLIAEQPVRP